MSTREATHPHVHEHEGLRYRRERGEDLLRRRLRGFTEVVGVVVGQHNSAEEQRHDA